MVPEEQKRALRSASSIPHPDTLTPPPSSLGPSHPPAPWPLLFSAVGRQTSQFVSSSSVCSLDGGKGVLWAEGFGHLPLNTFKTWLTLWLTSSCCPRVKSPRSPAPWGVYSSIAQLPAAGRRKVPHTMPISLLMACPPEELSTYSSNASGTACVRPIAGTWDKRVRVAKTPPSCRHHEMGERPSAFSRLHLAVSHLPILPGSGKEPRDLRLG